MPAETADDVGRYVAALRTGCMLAIISGPASPNADQASHASARKLRYSGLWTLPAALPESARLNQIVIARLKSPEHRSARSGCSVVRLTTTNQKKLRVHGFDAIRYRRPSPGRSHC